MAVRGLELIRNSEKPQMSDDHIMCVAGKKEAISCLVGHVVRTR